MPMKPDLYVIGYENYAELERLAAKHGGDTDAVDPVDYWVTEDAGNDLEHAKKVAVSVSKNRNTSVTLYKRINFEPVHIPDTSLFEWEYDEESIGDVAGGKLEMY